MAIYLFSKDKMEELKPTTYQNEGIMERYDLQQSIRNNISVIADDCLIISEEYSEWADSRKRIDLLAIDKKGNLVIIELKRTNTGDHMELQSIRYAAMLSTFTFQKAIETYQRYLDKNNIEKDAKSELLTFIECDEESFASDIRIILASSDFSKELTTTVLWLRNEKNININCVKITPYKIDDKILIDSQQIIPLPESEDYMVKLKEQKEERIKSKKDKTKYKFEGKIYNKRQLVLVTIKKIVELFKPSTIDELSNKFSNKKIFASVEMAQKKPQRFFLNDDDLIIINDKKFAISNQWGIISINDFIADIRKIGINVEEIKL